MARGHRYRLSLPAPAGGGHSRRKPKCQEVRGGGDVCSSDGVRAPEAQQTARDDAGAGVTVVRCLPEDTLVLSDLGG